MLLWNEMRLNRTGVQSDEAAWRIPVRGIGYVSFDREDDGKGREERSPSTSFGRLLALISSKIYIKESRL